MNYTRHLNMFESFLRLIIIGLVVMTCWYSLTLIETTSLKWRIFNDSTIDTGVEELYRF